MIKKIFYINLSVWALLSACTAEHTEITPEQEKTGVVNILASSARDASGTDEIAFEANQYIAVYNGSTPKDITNPELRGIYQSPDTKNKQDNWKNIPKLSSNESDEQAIGLWKEDMSTNDNSQYVFTSVTYNSGQTLLEDGKHEVETQQNINENFLKSDFLVARSIYENEDWKTNGISLLFHHVLSRLDIELYLPIGTAEDGLFNEDIKNTTTKEIKLLNATLNYEVDYSSTLTNRGLAGISKLQGTEQKTSTITMLAPIEAGEVITGIPGDKGQRAVKFTFKAILPIHQLYPSGRKCLEINIGGQKFSYAPNSDGLFSFIQEKITTIQLTLYSKKGSTKVNLGGVQVTDWKTDKTDIGDLIED